METELLNKLLGYMKMGDPTDEERAEVEMLGIAAAGYLGNAGVVRPPEPGDAQELYDMALCALALHYHDHRGDVSGEGSFPSGVRPVINQLKLLAALGGAGYGAV